MFHACRTAAEGHVDWCAGHFLPKFGDHLVEQWVISFGCWLTYGNAENNRGQASLKIYLQAVFDLK